MYNVLVLSKNILMTDILTNFMQFMLLLKRKFYRI